MVEGTEIRFISISGRICNSGKGLDCGLFMSLHRGIKGLHRVRSRNERTDGDILKKVVFLRINVK